MSSCCCSPLSRVAVATQRFVPAVRNAPNACQMFVLLNNVHMSAEHMLTLRTHLERQLNDEKDTVLRTIDRTERVGEMLKELGDNAKQYKKLLAVRLRCWTALSLFLSLLRIISYLFLSLLRIISYLFCVRLESGRVLTADLFRAPLLTAVAARGQRFGIAPLRCAEGRREVRVAPLRNQRWPPSASFSRPLLLLLRLRLPSLSLVVVIVIVIVIVIVAVCVRRLSVCWWWWRRQRRLPQEGGGGRVLRQADPKHQGPPRQAAGTRSVLLSRASLQLAAVAAVG